VTAEGLPVVVDVAVSTEITGKKLVLKILTELLNREETTISTLDVHRKLEFDNVDECNITISASTLNN
jgi:hypothetical protein